MKYTVYVVAIGAALAVAWFMMQPSTPITYVADVADEVASLEAELASIEAEVAAGTLTPEAAAAAQERIVARIVAIDAAVKNSERAQLTPAQRAQLNDGLERLKNILVTYQATFESVEVAAGQLPEAERPKLNVLGSRGGRHSVGTLIADIIAVVEDYAEDVIEDYEPEDTVPDDVTPEEFEDVVEAVEDDTAEAETETEVSTDEDTATGTEAAGDDMAEETEDNMSDPEETTDESVSDDEEEGTAPEEEPQQI